MNFNILQYLLGNFDLSIVIFIVTGLLIILIIIYIINIVKINGLRKKLAVFMTGKNARSLEDTMEQLVNDQRTLSETGKEHSADIQKIFANLQIAFQYCGIVKYDAYQQMGGKLSFSLALLDKDLNGFLLNSVHSTDSCYSYIKQIKRGSCEIELSDEERNALDIAVSKKLKKGFERES